MERLIPEYRYLSSLFSMANSTAHHLPRWDPWSIFYLTGCHFQGWENSQGSDIVWFQPPPSDFGQLTATHSFRNESLSQEFSQCQVSTVTFFFFFALGEKKKEATQQIIKVPMKQLASLFDWSEKQSLCRTKGQNNTSSCTQVNASKLGLKTALKECSVGSKQIISTDQSIPPSKKRFCS